MKVLAKRVVWIADEEGNEDTDLELRVVKNEDNEYVIKAFYFGRYISEDIYSAYEDDLESAMGTMVAEADWHEANPDKIGNTDKFLIRSA
jgi:hypothetical protein